MASVVHVLIFLTMRHVGVFALQAGIEPSPLALESEVLTIGLPGKFQQFLYMHPLVSTWLNS